MMKPCRLQAISLTLVGMLLLPGVLLQITRALAGGSDRAEILYQINGLIAHEFRPRPWLDGRLASLTHRFNGRTKKCRR